ncbi:alpha/beta-Hydrolases superfamily protein [Abeliophyllum distichum]|uniref:Alpha/beta-Hydrolases superfamily protein n=1 Tax=Abeliophyllum distichum TaxID=126358 RepID=A0ABD1T1Z3_9LAMI
MLELKYNEKDINFMEFRIRDSSLPCLMYGAENPSIAGMVKLAIHYLRRAILKKANFDIRNLNTIKVAKSWFVPVLIGHAVDDDFIQPRHSDLIFDAYMGDKNIIKFEGDHNSPRPQFYFDSITIFSTKLQSMN